MEIIEIQPATQNDQASIIAVIQSVFDEYSFILDLENEMADLVDLERNYDFVKGAFFVCTIDGQVVGTIGVKIEPENKEQSEIYRLYLLSEFRGKSIGYKLLDKACEWAEWTGIKRVELWSDTGFTAAHRLYTRYGFTRGPERQLTDINNSREYNFWLEVD